MKNYNLKSIMNKRENKVGSSLVMVIMILGIALISAVSVMLVSVRERKASIGAGRSDVAYHNADTGIEVVMKELLKGNYTNVFDIFPSTAPPFGVGVIACNSISENIEDASGSFSVELQNNLNVKINCSAALVSNVRYIKSTGISGQYQRSISAPVFQNNFTQVAAGTSHSLALDASGNVWAWGKNDKGQLGTGDATNKAYPVKVKNSTGGFLSGISQISAAGNYSLAVDYTGIVWAWGNNTDKQLGDGTVTQRNLPVNVKKDASNSLGVVATEKVQRIVGCGDFSLAMDISGKTWSWGASGDRLGSGGSGGYAGKVQDNTGDLNNVLDIACGNDNGVAISDGLAGIVWVWGDNTKCQTGTGSCSGSNAKAITNGTSGISKVAAGGDSVLALKNDGKVLAWGKNTYGQLGDGTTSDRSSPIAVSGLSSIDAISIGQNAAIFVDANNKVYVAGDRIYGLMGDSICSDQGDKKISGELGSSIKASSASVSAVGNHALLVDTNKKVKAWGTEVDNVLGNGSSASCQNVPAYVLF